VRAECHADDAVYDVPVKLSQDFTAIIRPGRPCGLWAPSIRARITGGRLVYHITSTRLSAVAATGGSLGALGDSFISQLTLAVKLNGI